MTSQIKTLFANDITRQIEEVIKVDQTDEESIRFEIDEYVTTNAIERHYEEILDSFVETPNKPHEGVGVWVSGFFGSGKSSFAKMLGLALENRKIEGTPAAERFAQRTNDKIKVLLNSISESIPTHAVIFDVSTERGIRTGNKTLTEIMYRLFLESLGYPGDLDLAELEIGLEADNELEEFKTAFEEVTDGKSWDERKKSKAFALSEASAAMRKIKPGIYDDNDSWADLNKNNADITPGTLAQRVNQLMAQRKPDHTVVFVVDEVGQFVARDVQKMLDLQAIVQQFGVHGRGKQWLIVTSQEKLGEMVGGLDDTRIELARLMDRFKAKPHLEPSDISEVTSKRVLAKNAGAETELGELFEQCRGQLTSHTKLSADITLPELSRAVFIDLYPLLPYQIDLIIQVVSGLRTQGGASKHVGGANRTIIKLAQQVLIHPDVALGDQELGQLARLDQIYDLVESNIEGEVRAKIHKIPEQVADPNAQAVAKTICLLQFVQSVHRTAENVAAALHPATDAPSQLEQVKESLRVLEEAGLVRHGDDGYRIPTPAEDDWERLRTAVNPRPADTKRLHREALTGFWSPSPTHLLHDVKSFKAGLVIDGREEEKGDLSFHLSMAQEGQEYTDTVEQMRSRSQQEEGTVFWVVPLTGAIDRTTVELFRSKEMLSRKARDAKTKDETALVSEERGRERRHQSELQRLLREAVLRGTAFFRGNDRSPAPGTTDVAKAASGILSQVLPDVFTRFDEGAAKAGDAKRGVDELLKAENLDGLPAVFSQLGLLRDEGGQTVIDPNAPALREVEAKINSDADYGHKATGKSLTEHFGSDPFGWEFDVTRLLVASLLAADRIQLRHGSNVIDSRRGPAAKDAIGNNNNFKSASCSPKVAIDFAEIAKAAGHFKDTFGTEVPELNQSAVASTLRSELNDREEQIRTAAERLRINQLPGNDVLELAIGPIRSITRGTDEAAVGEFNTSFQSIKDAMKRAGELDAVTDEAIADVVAAQHALTTQWPLLQSEPDLDASIRDTADSLADLLKRETFFRELSAIESARQTLVTEHNERLAQALSEKVSVYEAALKVLVAMEAWSGLSDDVKAEISAPLRHHAEDDGGSAGSIQQIRADRDACEGRRNEAMAKVHAVIDGDRIAHIDLRSYFGDGVETAEQLAAVLDGIREKCEELIAADKKIVIR